MPEQLPSRITLEALALSPAEQRAFPRWYTDLLLRKRSESVAIGDVLSFLDNFGISHADKVAITHMFSGNQLVTLDPPQFYVFLRLTGHLLQGKQLRRELAYMAAPVPRPRSILSRKSHKSRTSSGSAKDMDSFMSLMMAGKNGAQKRKKRVTFDARPPQVTEAAHRSMGELLRQSGLQQQLGMLPHAAPPPPEPEPEPAAANAEPEVDQPIANNQFARVNIESVLHHGQSSLPEPPAPRKAKGAGDSYIQQLTQQHTGSQSQSYSAPASQQPAPPPPRRGMQPQLSGMQPQLSGMQPQLSGMQPQLSGMQPQLSGIQQPLGGVQPQLSGMQQLGGMQPQLAPVHSGYAGVPSVQVNDQRHQLNPTLTGPANQMFQPSLPSHRIASVSPQVSGMPAQQINMVPMTTQSMALPQMTQHMPQQLSGQQMGAMSGQPQPTQAMQPGLQFLNSVQVAPAYQIAAPPQYVRSQNQPYNMQQLRDQLPNW